MRRLFRGTTSAIEGKGPTAMTRMRSAICASILIAAIMLTGAFTLRVAAHPAGRQSPGPLHQNYSFGVPELLMHAYVQPDGSTRIVYDITFVNAGGPIDIVDVGTPNDDYNIAEMTASVDGQPVTDIRRSTYIDVGVEIHLGSAAIAPGDTGTLHLEFVSPDMVYGDTTNEENASLQIAPTWFDSSVIRGTSTIEISVTTLAGIEADDRGIGGGRRVRQTVGEPDDGSGGRVREHRTEARGRPVGAVPPIRGASRRRGRSALSAAAWCKPSSPRAWRTR